jgi:hypothetical protein
VRGVYLSVRVGSLAYSMYLSIYNISMGQVQCLIIKSYNIMNRPLLLLCRLTSCVIAMASYVCGMLYTVRIKCTYVYPCFSGIEH